MRAVKAVLTMLGICCALFLLGLLLPSAVTLILIGASVAVLGCLLLPPAPVKG